MIRFETAESVTMGHPDKLCDYIADCILDAYLEQDENSRVACEVVASKNLVLVTGEITSRATINIEEVVRNAIIDVGYSEDNLGFNGKTCEIEVRITEQSLDIDKGVSQDDDLGAGDQGIMIGYACDETDAKIPICSYYASILSKRLTEIRRNKEVSFLRPDGKTQVTVEYIDDIPKRIDTIIISCQHEPFVDDKELKNIIKEKVIYQTIPKELLDESTKIEINPTGRFVLGGPMADSGLTGRKIIVDTYGPQIGHGGGAFSGKDPTKVDRTAAYYSRYVAKNIVASNLAKKCRVEIAYAIGKKEKISLNIDTYQTGIIKDEKIKEIVEKVFDFTPKNMINELNLRKIKYSRFTNFGHMGRIDLQLPWEKEDRIEEIRELYEKI